jgi:hypothetical protein
VRCKSVEAVDVDFCPLAAASLLDDLGTTAALVCAKRDFLPDASFVRGWWWCASFWACRALARGDGADVVVIVVVVADGAVVRCALLWLLLLSAAAESTLGDRTSGCGVVVVVVVVVVTGKKMASTALHSEKLTAREA